MSVRCILGWRDRAVKFGVSFLMRSLGLDGHEGFAEEIDRVRRAEDLGVGRTLYVMQRTGWPEMVFRKELRSGSLTNRKDMIGPKTVKGNPGESEKTWASGFKEALGQPAPLAWGQISQPATQTRCEAHHGEQANSMEIRHPGIGIWIAMMSHAHSLRWLLFDERKDKNDKTSERRSRSGSPKANAPLTCEHVMNNQTTKAIEMRACIAYAIMDEEITRNAVPGMVL